VTLEFDAGRVTVLHTGCGLEHDVESDVLFSDAMPMALVRKREFNDDEGVEETWYELAPRPAPAGT
jgi:hypothetical protein